MVLGVLQNAIVQFHRVCLTHLNWQKNDVNSLEEYETMFEKAPNQSSIGPAEEVELD